MKPHHYESGWGFDDELNIVPVQRMVFHSGKPVKLKDFRLDGYYYNHQINTLRSCDYHN